jgi:hypothetical protein
MVKGEVSRLSEDSQSVGAARRFGGVLFPKNFSGAAAIGRH